MQKIKDSELYQLIFKHSTEGMMITDLDGKIIEVNESFSKITGYSKEEVIGKNPSILHSGYQHDDFYSHFWEAIKAEGHWEGEIWNRSKAGEIYPEWLSVFSINGEGSKPKYYIGRFTDITFRKREEKQLKLYANQDPLTALLNRRCFLERFQTLYDRLNGKKFGAIFYLDLDSFKPINDTYGHEIGDAVLKIVAMRIKRMVRGTDIVARLGGDEFVVILDHLETEQDCKRFGEKLHAKIVRKIGIEGTFYQVGVSIGACLFKKGDMDIKAILNRADETMYSAKQSENHKVQLASCIGNN